MDIQRLFNKVKGMYEVSDVKRGYDYWFFKILNLLLQMFEYENLPEGLPAREIECNLLLTGHCCIVPVNDGTLFAPLSSIYGFDRYYNSTRMCFANPVINSSREWRIHEDCEIIYNSSLKESIWYIKTDDGLLTFIGRYARMLADIESTINIYTVNARLTSAPVTDDNNVAQSIKAFFKGLVSGKREIITDSSMIENFRNVEFAKPVTGDKANDWLVARDKILEQMYRDLGIRMYNPKRAQVTESELESNDQLLLIAADDMLKSRQEGIDRVNNMFGTNIQVYLSEKFDIQKVQFNYGVNENMEVNRNEDEFNATMG